MANKNSVAINELSAKGAQTLVNYVNENLNTISKGYLTIAPMVAKLYDGKAYKALGYKNFDDMCVSEFAMSHGTTVGIRKVFKEFGEIDKNGAYAIKENCLEWGYTKLLLFANSKDDFKKAGIDPFEAFNPNMTIKEMTTVLKGLLEDKTTKDEQNAIDTTSEEMTSEDTISEDTKASPIDSINAIVDDITTLLNDTKASVKPEKWALLESAIANLKEYKKALKNVK